MIFLLAIAYAAACPETIRIGHFTETDIRNTTGLHEACARRHGGDKNWCAHKITKKGEGNYHVICKNITHK